MYTFKDDILKISVRSLVEFICREGDMIQDADAAVTRLLWMQEAELTAAYKSRWVRSMRRRFL